MRARSLMADAGVHRQRILALALKELGAAGVRKELTEQLWPFLEEMARCIMEDVLLPMGEIAQTLEEQGDAIEAMIDGEGDLIHQEFATRIISVFEIGRVACGELEKLTATLHDDLAKKRNTEIISNYRKLATMVEQEVMDATIDAAEQSAAPEEETTSEEPQEEDAEGKADKATGATIDAEGANQEG